MNVRLKTPPSRLGFSKVAVAISLLTACSPTPTSPVTAAGRNGLPSVMPDPLEPINRGIWAVNRGILVGALQPAGRAYRTVVQPPVRKSIAHFTRNATYPGRLINHALQGRWQGAGDESLRFLTNTTVGVAGFFDVATRWQMPKSDANFGQTFSAWGWQPSTYLMLPLLGPSDNMHAVGTAADELAKPWNYRYPYKFAAIGSRANDLAETSETASRFARSDADAYHSLKYFWSYASKETPPDWALHGTRDSATLDTFSVAAIQTRDPEFAQQSHELAVLIPTTGKRLKFNYWIQQGPAPLAYITPGLGTHKDSQVNLSLAELLYQDGFSVVTTSGSFHPDFMEHAATTSLPGYPPVDSQDLLVSLTEIDRALAKEYPERLGKRALVGCSMGGFQALYLAAREKRADPAMVKFDRYVAIDTPVNLYHGIKNIDGFYDAPLAWPAAKRQALMDNAFHKAAKLAQIPRAFARDGLPFSATESKFLVALSFRLTLQNTIFSSQSRANMGVLKTPISKWRREQVYQEIFGFSFRNYFDRLVLPYYRTRGVTAQDFIREVSLTNTTTALRTQQKVRVMVNQNDFLLGPGDLSWLQSTFGKSRLTVFPSGGHLGNLGSPPVQSAVLHALQGLK
jgi:ABC-type transporter lipoprotein component MlaA/pimeloyl-ACP methyl ester carboxylesterase